MSYNKYWDQSVGRPHRLNRPRDHQLFVVSRHNQRQANGPPHGPIEPARRAKIANDAHRQIEKQRRCEYHHRHCQRQY
jgi:hypothetical protein